MEQRPNVLIATPCYGSTVAMNHHMSVVQLCLTQGIEADFGYLIRSGDALITRMRNQMVAEFLADPRGYTHLFWIDADVGFEPTTVDRMVRANLDVVAAVYPSKRIIWPEEGVTTGTTERLFRGLHGTLPYNVGEPRVVPEDGFVEVLDAPTGMMLIKRSVITSMMSAYPELRYVEDHVPGRSEAEARAHDELCFRLFDTMYEESTGRYLSEDYAFCRRWQAMGGRVFVDAHAELNHQGTHLYRGSIREQLEARRWREQQEGR